MWLLAATSDISLSEYGLLGAALASAVSAVVYLARSQIKREADRSDRLESELREANQRLLSVLTETVMPGLSKMSGAMEDFGEIQQKVYDHLQRLLEVERRPKR